MKILTVNCSCLYTLLIILNLAYQVFSQLTLKYNECSINHCISCDDKTQLCTQCEEGYYFDREQLLCSPVLICPLGEYMNKQSQDCQKCHPRCKKCYGPEIGECIECVEGYAFDYEEYYQIWISDERYCVSCGVKNCRTCFSRRICNICNDGYFLNKETETCDPCLVKNCKECNSNPSACDLCFSSYTLVPYGNNKYCNLKSGCGLEFYKDTNGSCNSCDISCYHCYSPESNQCYQCKTGYYLNGDTCQKCDSSCLTCKYSPYYCTSCLSEFPLNGRVCDINKYSCYSGVDSLEYNKNGKCEPCHKFCRKCIDFDNCVICFNGFSLIDGKCVDNEEQCSYKSYCKTCQSTQLLSRISCVSNCQVSEYIQYDRTYGLNICMPCPFPCITCKDRFTCTKCASPKYQLQNGKCVDSNQVIQNCSLEKVSSDQNCIDRCLDQFNLSKNYCYCNINCRDCTFYEGKNIGKDECNCTKDRLYQLYPSYGMCQPQCPKNLIKFTDISNYCVDQCPEKYLNQISLNEIKCVKVCDQGFDTFDKKKYCGKFPCKKGTYFDYDQYLSEINNEENIDDLTIYCKACDKACDTCYGKLNSNCLKCKDHYFQQMRSIQGQNQMHCLDKCDDGYENKIIYNDNKCRLCTYDCLNCAVGKIKEIQDHLQSIKDVSNSLFKCIDTCETPNRFDNINNKCKFMVYSNITLQQKEKILNSFSNSLNIQLILYLPGIHTKTDFKLIFSIYSSDNKQISELSMTKQNIWIEEYKSEININQLEEGKIYNVKCSGENDYFFFDKVEEIRIYKLIKGDFNINKEIVTDDDRFTVNITQFNLINIDPKSKIDLRYEIQAADRYYEQYKNKEIFFQQNLTLTNNTSNIFDFYFSQIMKPTPVYIYLIVIIEDTKQYIFNKTICLKPYQYINSLELVSPTLINITPPTLIKNNFELNISEFAQFIYDLKRSSLIPHLDQIYRGEFIVQTNKNERLIHNQLFWCDERTSCSGNGKCKTEMNTYFDKCECDEGFKGESCGWKIADLQFIKETCENFLIYIENVINNLQENSPYLVEILDLILRILNEMVQIRDIFEDSFISENKNIMINININCRFLKILNMDNLIFFMDSDKFLFRYIELNDNSINLLRKSKIDYDEIIQNIEYILSRKSQFKILVKGQFLYLNNINLFFKDLNSSNNIQNQAILQNDLNYDNLNVILPQQQLIDLANQYYMQIIDLPNDSFQFQTIGSKSFTASRKIMVSIRKQDNSSEVFPIKNYTQPIQIILKRLIKDSDIFDGYKIDFNCIKHSNKQTSPAEMLEYIDLEDDNIKCFSNQLDEIFYLSLDIIDFDFKTKVFLAINTSLILLIQNCGYFLSKRVIKDFEQQKKKQQQKLQQMFLCSSQKLQQQSQNQQQQQIELHFQKQRNEMDVSKNKKFNSLINEKDVTKGKEIELKGFHVATYKEQKEVEGIVIIKNDCDPNLRENTNISENVQKIQQINLCQDNILENGQTFDKIAQNIARRVKETEKDFDLQKDINIGQREVNLIPITAIIHPLQQQTQSQLSTKKQFKNLNQFQPHPLQINHVQIKENLPLGIPENEQEQVYYEQDKQLKEYVQDKQSMQQLKQFHAVYSFTYHLENTTIPLRIALFFQILSLYQLLTILFINYFKISSIQDLNFNNTIKIFFIVMLTKSILQFTIPIFLFAASFIHKCQCFTENQTQLKYMCILVLTACQLTTFWFEASSIHYKSKFYAFMALIFLNVVIDQFILDFFVIKIQQLWKKSYLEKLIRLKNLDFKF